MTRRRLYLLGLLPLAAALLLTLKVAVMLHYNGTGRDRLEAGDLAGAAGAFADSGLVNVLEPWVAPYDEGTTAYLRDEYDDARVLLERALADVPEEEQCRVRTNLALTHEALGDAARADGELAAARTAWATGRTVLAAGRCLAEADQRLAGKLRDTSTEQTRTPPPRRDDEQATLEDRNRRAEQQRREAEQRRERPPKAPTAPDDSDEEAPPPPVYHW